MTNYFTGEMLANVSEEDVGEYPLPFGTEEIIVRVKSVSMARMKQYQDAVQKGGAVAIAAGKALIRDSILNPDGTPVYGDAAKAEAMMKGRTRLIAALLQMINKHNGGDDKIADDAEKKSEATE